MDPVERALSKFFGVVIQGRTYLNALYLLLAFPLGLFYFIFLVTGISLGVGLAILWVGLFVLLAVFAAWYGFAAFERWLAIVLLGETIPPMIRQDLRGKNLWQKFVAALGSPATWKGLAYLFARFPLGILSFVIVVTLVSFSGALLATPFYYQYVHANIGLTFDGTSFAPMWVIDTLPKALIASLIGLIAAILSLHVFNGLAFVSGKFARVMLGNFSIPPAAPAAPIVPVSPDAGNPVTA